MRERTVFLSDSDLIFERYLTEAIENLNVIYPNSYNDHAVSDYVIINNATGLKDKALKTRFCFVNMDNKVEGDIRISGTLVTYGIGTKNTVTVSSIEENNFVYCIQSYLDKNNEETIEPQEIPINIEIYNDTHLYALLVSITIALIEGMNGKEIEKKLSKKYLSI
jgi:hypothetical protein